LSEFLILSCAEYTCKGRVKIYSNKQTKLRRYLMNEICVRRRSTSFGAFSHSCVLKITGQCRGSLITRAVLTLTDYRLGRGPRSGHTTEFCCKWQCVLWKRGCAGRGEWPQSLRHVRSRFMRSVLGGNHFGATTVTRSGRGVGGPRKMQTIR
jgi:hypothetical protein